MEIQGKTCKKTCVVIPIDNEQGTVQDCYEAKVDGISTVKPLGDVQLNLTAFEFREKKYGHTHGLKAAFSRSFIDKISEEELRQMPFIGNMKSWTTAVADDDDLPIGDSKEDW